MIAFLNPLIKKIKIYIELSDNYEKDGFVTLLRKILYDLKQSANQWFEALKKLFIKLGFIQLQSDTAVFIKNADMDYIVIAAVHINDILLIKPFRTAIKMAKKRLKRGYQMNNLGLLIIFLGTQVSKILLIEDIYLSQSSYINKILNIFGLKDLSPRDILIKSKLRLTKTKVDKKSFNEFRK